MLSLSCQATRAVVLPSLHPCSRILSRTASFTPSSLSLSHHLHPFSSLSHPCAVHSSHRSLPSSSLNTLPASRSPFASIHRSSFASSFTPSSSSPPGTSSPPGVQPSLDKKEGTAPPQHTQASAVPKPNEENESTYSSQSPRPSSLPTPPSPTSSSTTSSPTQSSPTLSVGKPYTPSHSSPIIRSSATKTKLPSPSPSSSSSSSAAASSSSPNFYDLVVIGSGPAGQKCAINAAKMKKRVAIIDKREMFGGVCIHTGTIPSKTFREAVLYLTGYRQRGFYGKGYIRRDEINSVDILDRVRKVEQWETQTILDQLQRNRIHCIQGTARFIDEHNLEVQGEKGGPLDGSAGGMGGVGGGFDSPERKGPRSGGDDSSTTIIQAAHTLICCGTRPARNDLFPFESPLVFDADQILQRETWDSVRHLIVIGGGVIAIEYASMFNQLPGCRVTIIDEKPAVLDFIDHEVVQTLRHIMGRSGATFRLGEKVVRVEALDTTVRVVLDSGKTVTGDALFYAVGRQANTDTLGLEKAGVQTAKRGLITVNEFFQTNKPHIYAAGDVIGFPALASTAMEQGRLASNHMFGQGRLMKPLFPYGIYTIPEISVIGASEQELTRQRIPFEVGLAKFEETAKGQMIGGQHIDGFLKLLFDPTTRKLLGCAAIGESAVEIIHIGQSVMSLGGTIDYFRDSVFNYPTMTETYRIAALDGLGRLGING